MDVQKTKLPGVLQITQTPFEDFRGQYREIYNEARFKAAGINLTFVADDVSSSTKDVLRGFHCDTKTYKYISCPYGKIYLVIVNCNEGSPDFGKWESFILTRENGVSILVPPEHGVAHLVLSELALFFYMQTEYYDRNRQRTYVYNDPRFKVWWPKVNVLLTERDEVGHYV